MTSSSGRMIVVVVAPAVDVAAASEKVVAVTLMRTMQRIQIPILTMIDLMAQLLARKGTVRIHGLLFGTTFRWYYYC